MSKKNEPNITVIVNVPKQRLLNAEHAALYLGISKALLYQLTEHEKIKSVRINSRRLFDTIELDEYVDSLKEKRGN